ncbi:Do family serine endopeptidase [Thalassotalea profundi]|uniref:Serine endoprotease DegQ n=1 Tax=Thalassotalea profundi TaxID=2036687 RepID=A0ABQ3J3B0_9GAMM|nr:Do family serine endopeptidase [Thalassotalea profundi]GHE99483.1 serine endoprotease DegQ [Thalassotalea profundi]
MNKMSIICSSILLSTTLAMASLPAQANLPLQLNGQQMPSLAPMLEKVTPAVVLISVKGTHAQQQKIPDAFKFFFGNPRQNQSRERPFRGLGSGVIIDAEKGYIVTNNHVIKEADEIQITLKDGRQIEAKKIGADESSDIALLEVDPNNLTEIKVADSDKLRVGDFTVAIGSPFGLGQTVTSGIVSALGRSGLNNDNYEDFIQTDAAINSGNSGGALVNLRGELIGINTAIIGPNGGNVGIGFAIPSNMVKNIISQILEFGEVRRGVLGVSGYSVNGEIAKAMELDASQGGFVERVAPNSAAEEAGIEAGDVITQVNGKRVKGFSELRGKIGSIGAGKDVELTVIKANGKTKTYTVTLKKAENANIEPASIHEMLDGAKLSNQTNALGVIIESVEEDSPAEVIGLRKGDIIAGVNKVTIKNIAELRDYLAEIKGISLLKIIRGNTILYVRIR